MEPEHSIKKKKLVMGGRGNPVLGLFAWILVSAIQQLHNLIRGAVSLLSGSVIKKERSS